MKFSGELTVKAPRAEVYKAVRDARFFASCVEGVSDLTEIGPDSYAAVFETKVAYMKFKFKVTVEVVRADPPERIEAKVEGTPLGIVGRLTATSVTTLTEAVDGTKIGYDVDTWASRCCAPRPKRWNGNSPRGSPPRLQLRASQRRSIFRSFPRQRDSSKLGPRFRRDERHSIFYA
jgi:uncharacterized protein